ncbi:MAG: NAD-binding protein [Actinobacteria bacterium]|nr:NAD-binding protein [Actinomycetota bacterium]
METVGFIGTGGMGSRMARNVLAAGFDLVVTDVRPEATSALVEAGATFQPTAAAVAESSGIVLSMLPTSDSVREVALGPDGLLAATSGAREWIDFSSIDKPLVVELGERMTSSGWQLLDASVNGVEEEAAAGTLRSWASGPKSVFDARSYVLEAMSSTVVYLGDLGNAKLVKTANAMLAGIMHMSMMEVYTWVTSAGMSEYDYEAFICSSRNFSPAIERVMKIMLSHRFKERTSWMAKDIAFGLDAAREMQIPVPISALTHEMFTIAQANGVANYEATGVAWEAYALLAGRDRFPPTEGVPLETHTD